MSPDFPHLLPPPGSLSTHPGTQMVPLNWSTHRRAAWGDSPKLPQTVISHPHYSQRSLIPVIQSLHCRTLGTWVNHLLEDLSVGLLAVNQPLFFPALRFHLHRNLDLPWLLLLVCLCACVLHATVGIKWIVQSATEKNECLYIAVCLLCCQHTSCK